MNQQIFCTITCTLVEAALGYDVMIIFIHWLTVSCFYHTLKNYHLQAMINPRGTSPTRLPSDTYLYPDDNNITSTNVLVTTGSQRHERSNYSIRDNTWFSFMSKKKETTENKELSNFLHQNRHPTYLVSAALPFLIHWQNPVSTILNRTLTDF